MRRLALPLLLLAVGGLVYWWFQPAQVLKRRTQKVLRTLTLRADEPKTNRRLGLYTLSALLASQVEFDAPPSLDQATGWYDHTEVESAFSWLCDQAVQARFDLHQIHAVTIDQGQADVTFSLDAFVEVPGRRLADGRYWVTFHWQLDRDTWHLARAKWVEAGG